MIERDDKHFYNPYEFDADLCPKCETELENIRDGEDPCLLCPICDLGQPRNIETDFYLNWYGMDEYQSFENGLLSESRKDMAELQVWWAENFHWEIREYQSGKYVEADILDGNDAGQWFIYSRGYQIGCITEKQNG